ncbi:hypothetical protein EDC94DRAFT_691250 [Helicostylum pulchrum]|nr:hypothetical protein EDC94DRAFT_691250 [Helicostylum pulchrum]
MCDDIAQDTENDIPNVAIDNVDNGNSVALNITEESTANATSDNISLGAESDEKDIQNFSNAGDNFAEYEVVEEEAGSTFKDNFVSKYLASVQSRLKGGVIRQEYRRRTYWADVQYGGFDYDTRYILSPTSNKASLFKILWV